MMFAEAVMCLLGNVMMEISVHVSAREWRKRFVHPVVMPHNSVAVCGDAYYSVWQNFPLHMVLMQAVVSCSFG